MKRFLKVTLLCFAAVMLSTAVHAKQTVIGIANFLEHPDLQLVIDGFKEEIKNQGFTDVKYIYEHANRDISVVPQTIHKVKSSSPDIIITVTTPISQASVKMLKGSNIPAVFMAVTDPVGAKLTPSWTQGAPMMTGASDLQDVGGVLKFITNLIPTVKKVGVPFNPGEANDVSFVEILKEQSKGTGVEIIAVGIESTNDIPQGIRSFGGKVDALYIPASNLLQPSFPAVTATADIMKMPVFSSSPTAVKAGQALATFSVYYPKVGANAAKLAAKILKGEKPGNLAPVKPAYADHVPVISKKRWDQLGIMLPEDLKGCGCFTD